VPSIQKLTARLRAHSFHRGLLGTSRPWLAVWAMLVSARYVRRFLAPKTEVMYRSELLPGESLVISHGSSVEVVSTDAGT
jgi:hypothetical protein